VGILQSLKLRKREAKKRRVERTPEGEDVSLGTARQARDKRRMAPAVVHWAQERAIQLKVILYKNYKVAVWPPPPFSHFFLKY
jgi:hypothetical protein